VEDDDSRQPKYLIIPRDTQRAIIRLTRAKELRYDGASISKLRVYHVLKRVTPGPPYYE
jgi:hypothetical protein